MSGRAEGDAARTLGEPDLEAFTRWLEQTPPYDLVGRVVCEAAALEIGLVQCAHQAGTALARLGKMSARQVLQVLRDTSHPDPQISHNMLARVADLLDQRDVLAHSAPMNLWGRPQHGFVKLNRPANNNFLWHGFETQELEELARELGELAELVQSVVLTYRNACS